MKLNQLYNTYRPASENKNIVKHSQTNAGILFRCAVCGDWFFYSTLSNTKNDKEYHAWINDHKHND